ncbi:MAG: hemolysin III family protein [Spirochaetales bacterium]|jgi:hemolysin III|nr:hemolysin III family protein [Spirochaetales bacterium]
MKTLPSSFYSLREETANSVIHGIGTLLAITGLVLLIIRSRGLPAGREDGALMTISCILFAGTMICMFLTSTLYHAVRRQNVKRVLRVLDHSAIYLLIAGTYTPFCLVALKGGWGWSLFGLEWGMAFAGITIHCLNIRALKKFELIVHLLMGWAIAAGWFVLVRSVSRTALILLVSGGVLYTLGVFWYRKKNVPGAHAVWHVFVLAGAVCHWVSVWNIN